MQFIVLRPDWQSWWFFCDSASVGIDWYRGMEAKTQKWNVSSYENVGLICLVFFCVSLQVGINALLLLFLLVLLLGFLFSCSLLLTLGCLRISSLFAWSDSEPLWQLLGGTLRELGELLLPVRLQPLGPDHLGATLVQLLAVAVAPGVRPPLVLGEHPDGGGVLLGEGLRVKTLLDGRVPLLQLLPLSQLLQLVILVKLPLLIVVLVGLELEDCIKDLLSLALQLVRVHAVQVQGLDADSQGNLHLLLNLLLGLGHLFASVHGGTRGLLASLLLGGH